MLQVCRAVFVRRCANRDKLHLAVCNCPVHIGGEVEPANFNVADNHIVETGLMNRDDPFLEVGDFGLVKTVTFIIVIRRFVKNVYLWDLTSELAL